MEYQTNRYQGVAEIIKADLSDRYGEEPTEQELWELVEKSFSTIGEIVRYHMEVELACACTNDGCQNERSHKADQYNFKYLFVGGKGE